MLRTQDFIAPVGGGITVQIKANYIKYLEGSAAGLSTRIRIRTELGGADLTMEPGDAVRLPNDTAQFTVENANGEAAIKGVLLVGVGEFTSNRVVGTVEVIDTSRAISLAGASFSRGVLSAAPEVGKLSYMQAWNPVGSGKVCLVESAAITIEAADGFTAGMVSSPLATLDGAFPNKDHNAASGVMQARYENDAAEKLAGASKGILAMKLAAGVPVVIPLKRPIVIREGYGLTLRPWSVNIAMSMWLEVSEVNA